MKVNDTFISSDIPVIKLITGAGITVTPAEAGGDVILTFAVTTTSTTREIAFALGGQLAPTVGQGTYPVTYAATITGVLLRVGTAPTGTVSTPITGASLVCDVNKNGTSVFTTQANRPNILAAASLSALAVPAVTTLASGDWLSVDIDYVGSTVPGSDLTVLVQLAV